MWIRTYDYNQSNHELSQIVQALKETDFLDVYQCLKNVHYNEAIVVHKMFQAWVQFVTYIGILGTVDIDCNNLLEIVQLLMAFGVYRDFVCPEWNRDVNVARKVTSITYSSAYILNL